MRFQILSHAGLLVEGSTTSLVCDPWLIGSCYWRSWWNYPPVSKELLHSLSPDYICLTHVHWDHFHGLSLKLFRKSTPIIVPKGHYSKLKDDLTRMRFSNIIELKHGESIALDKDFTLTSYQFLFFLDSAVVIETEGITLLNLNDSKHMGLPLRQIVTRHPKIDFVFRSHSSANERLNFSMIDDPEAKLDDNDAYMENFADTVRVTGARYAVPFASNHCYLRREVLRFNRLIQTPKDLDRYFRQHRIRSPELKVLVSGDGYDSESGFLINETDYFENREEHLNSCLAAQEQTLEKQYKKENGAIVTLQSVEDYFEKLFAAVPHIVRRIFKGHPILFVLRAGENQWLFEVDPCVNSIRELEEYSDEETPIQYHLEAFIMNQCMKHDMFSHLATSKLVTYRVTTANKKYVDILNLIFNCYEYGIFPLKKRLRFRFFETWLLRWREVVLAIQLAYDVFRHGKLDLRKYLRPRTYTW